MLLEELKIGDIVVLKNATETNYFDLLRKMQLQASYHKKYNE